MAAAKLPKTQAGDDATSADGVSEQAAQEEHEEPEHPVAVLVAARVDLAAMGLPAPPAKRWWQT